MLKINGLSIGYKFKKTNKILLSDLNLDVKKGETVALLGTNGAGKSTLLRSIALMQNYVCGEIFLSGKELKSYGRKELAKKLSFSSTEIIKIKYLKVNELVSLARYPYFSGAGRLPASEKKIVANALSTIGMSDYAQKNINELSDGERQKVMIAGALAQDTDIIILDEPASFLDIENKYSVYEILKNLANDKNKSLIYSTHDLSIALKHADKIWLIRGNSIIQGSPEDLIMKGIFSDFFKNPKIYFNKKTYNFSYKPKMLKPIFIIDNLQDKNIYNLTVNALKRKAYFISEKKNDVNLNIFSEKGKIIWKLETKNNKTEFYSIYDLLLNI